MTYSDYDSDRTAFDVAKLPQDQREKFKIIMYGLIAKDLLPDGPRCSMWTHIAGLEQGYLTFRWPESSSIERSIENLEIYYRKDHFNNSRPSLHLSFDGLLDKFGIKLEEYKPAERPASSARAAPTPGGQIVYS